MSAALRVLLTGGGTGGHVYPALAVVDDCARRGISAEFRFVGSADGLEGAIVSKTTVPFETVRAGAIRGRSVISALVGLARNFRGAIEARNIILSTRPDVVLATGGFVCVPVVLAARTVGVPVVIYLPDLRPGWAVCFLARFASAVAVSFDEVASYVPSSRVVTTGYPVRSDLGIATEEAARKTLDLPEREPVVLVLGGSRGAQSINQAVVAGAARLVERAIVIHATGMSQYDDSCRRLSAILPANASCRYRLYPYLNAELAPALAAATVFVSRAGASTLGELPAVGGVGVLIPYPHAGAHQDLNAAFLARHDTAVIVDDETVSSGRLVDTILDLIADPERRRAMSIASKRLARPDAAKHLFELLEDVAHTGRAGVRGGSLA